MIQELTKEQEARFPEYIKKWTEIGLSCEPVDLPQFKRGVELSYGAAGLKPPSEIIVCDSPVSSALTAATKDGKSVFNSVKISVNSVRNSVWNSVWNSVNNSVGNSVSKSVCSRVWNSVFNGVFRSVSLVSNSVWTSYWSSLRKMNYGLHEAPFFFILLVYAGSFRS